jgi:hypothetical protein
MNSKRLTMAVLAAGSLIACGALSPAGAQSGAAQVAYNVAPTEMVSNGPQASPGDTNWSARRDVIQSRRYDRLLETNLAFRRFRERKECAPLTLPTLRRQCFASFQQYEPVIAGSRHAPYRYRHHPSAG